jgi:hypothetical protein
VQVESAFQQQRDEYERRIASIETESSASAREYTAVMEARLQSLVIRLAEAESAAKTNDDRAQQTQSYAEEASIRCTAAEKRLSEVTRELQKTRDDAASAAAIAAAQLEGAQGRLRHLEHEMDAANGTIARLQADYSSADKRARDREEELAASHAAWERRFSQLESSSSSARDEQLGAVLAQRDLLAAQLRTALLAAGNASAAASLTNAMSLQQVVADSEFFSSAARAGLVSAPLLAAAPKFSPHARDTSGAEADVRASGQFLAQTLQTKETRANELLSQLQSMDEELVSSKQETARLREALAQARGQIATLQTHFSGSSIPLHNPIPSRGNPEQAGGQGGQGGQYQSIQSTSSLSTHFTGHMGAVSPPPAPWSAPTRARAASPAPEAHSREVEALRSHCAELEGQTTAFRAVIADMRSHMELLQQQLDSAQMQHSQQSAMVEYASPDAAAFQRRVALAEMERDELSRELTQAQDYIRLLQQRAEAAYAPNSTSPDEHAELLMLRNHVRSLSESTAQLRNRLRQAHTELSTLKAASPAAPSTSPTSSAPAPAPAPVPARAPSPHQPPAQPAPAPAADPRITSQLRAANDDVARLLQERDKLLELSNHLRSDLNKALSRGQSSPAPAPAQRVHHAPVAYVEHQPAPAHRVVHAPIAYVEQQQAARAAKQYAPVTEETLSSSRLAYLESALVSLTEQNAQLQSEMRKFASGVYEERPRARSSPPRAHRRQDEEEDEYVQFQSAPAPPPQPPARSHSRSSTQQRLHAASEAVENSRAVPVAKPLSSPARSPSKARLDAAKRRITSNPPNPWASVTPVEEMSANGSDVPAPQQGNLPSGYSRVIAPTQFSSAPAPTALRVASARINPRYSAAAMAARQSSDDLPRAAASRTPTRFAAPSPSRSPVGESSSSSGIGAGTQVTGSNAAALAREKARQAAVVTARVRNYNDMSKL